MSQAIEQLNLLLLNVGLAIHNADWNWKDVSSPFARLYYVTEGKARIILPDSTQDLTPGHLYLIPAFVTHSYQCNSLFGHYYLHIYEDHRSESGLLEDWDFPVEVVAKDIDIELMQRLCEINPAMRLQQSNPTTYDNNPTFIQNIIKNKQRTFCNKVESRGIIYQLISRFLKEAKPKAKVSDNRIQEVLSYIRKNIFKQIDINTLSEISDLSNDHFIRLFKKEVGNTPIQYINQKKIEKAQLILITDNIPIKNIAYMLAFEDQSYFNRLFKKTVGLTPQKYRDSYIPKENTYLCI
ncbi:MAG: AraC family transcriptional regulator [Bacteroidaceae bacterium]|nr:AraC family transcriptional regulator [Bacteroidaceae bacterium]